MAPGARRWHLPLIVLALCNGLAQAEDLQACRRLRSQRDDLAARAMEQELALVRAYRKRICPRLALLAEGANAEDQRYAPINYASWSQCRLDAERALERSHPLRYRNGQGFTFYTESGGELAVQADRLRQTLKDQGCP